MKLVGYPDKSSVELGGAIEFMISSQLPRYQARVVRLIHGDPSPAGPGFKEQAVETELEGGYEGKEQLILNGSYARISTGPRFPIDNGFTLQMWVWATTPRKGEQTLISRRSPDAGSGFALRLIEGRLTLTVGEAEIALDAPLHKRLWYGVTAAYDAASGKAHVTAIPALVTERHLRASASASLPPGFAAGRVDADLLIGAEQSGQGDAATVGSFYNGKIDAPRVFDRARVAEAGGFLPAAAAPVGSGAGGLLAWWDFSKDISSREVTDVSGNGYHGRTCNKPARGMTGWNWDGSHTAWTSDPDQYGAIHFHDDDLDDAGWEPSIYWTVPEDFSSGVYALHLTGGEDEDYIPFVVRPRRGRPTAPILFVLPTFSHLAYANEHQVDSELVQGISGAGDALTSWPSTPEDHYIVENRLHSLYDYHSDGSGVCYSSRLRPILTQRPKYRTPALNDGDGSPHQFPADLCLVDWLHQHEYEFDVITDEDLHLEGGSLLSAYRVVLTGSHHEYWSRQMIDATQAFVAAGGRLMYLAANGMYWVTQLDPDTGAGIEIRRAPPSSRVWETEPGEGHLSATGEPGGIWRLRGCSPQSWVGIGFTAQGLGPGRPYERRPDSFDQRVAWAFEGIGDDEQIGDFPCLVNGYGAAGFELDRFDRQLGSPERTLVLATASRFSDSYQHVVEEVLISNSLQGGSVNPLVRADMTLLDYPNGGAVFSVGSISWTGCLSYNDYENNVSQMTKNVLDRFVSDVASVLD